MRQFLAAYGSNESVTIPLELLTIGRVVLHPIENASSAFQPASEFLISENKRYGSCREQLFDGILVRRFLFVFHTAEIA